MVASRRRDWAPQLASTLRYSNCGVLTGCRQYIRSCAVPCGRTHRWIRASRHAATKTREPPASGGSLVLAQGQL